jgi:hypothetical protein
VANNGPAESTGGIMTDVLPAGLTFVSSASGCTDAAGTVTCAFGGIPVGGSTALSFIAEVGDTQTTPLSNTATVSGNERDDVPDNDSATIVTPLAPTPPPPPAVPVPMLDLRALLALAMMLFVAGLLGLHRRQH